MRHLGLFEGIGGFSLAARWMGWETVAWVEINEFCQQVLKKNFPEAKGYGDIKQFDGTKYRGTIDIITGGFPCQPFSSAGKRKGTDDHRHLWPEMLRVIREVQPSYIVGENVYGLVNWSKGLVFEQVCTDLENEGYQVQPVILPACAVDAPHRRDRIWFVAYSNRNSKSTEPCNGRQGRGKLGVVTDAFNRGSQDRWSRRAECVHGKSKEWYTNTDHKSEIEKSNSFLIPEWQRFPSESPLCRGNDGVSNRVDRIKALGNAIVPQVAYEIFKAINQIK